MTFSDLRIGDRFVFADQPTGEPKEKTRPDRWLWAVPSRNQPAANLARPDREVIRIASRDA